MTIPNPTIPMECDGSCFSTSYDNTYMYVLRRPRNWTKDAQRPRVLEEIIGVNTGGPSGRRLGEAGHSEEHYLEFVDFIRYV